MKLSDPRQHLTYCLNIHPGENWAEQRLAVETLAAAVPARAGIAKPFGLGLRLSAASAEELAGDPAERVRFRSWLNQQKLYAFTVNAFPYGTFHGSRVKESVYRPDWRTRERLDYTLNTARILADLLPDGVDGSLSTVPGSFKPWIDGPEDLKAMAMNLAEAAWALAELETSQGRFIHLGLEPEPACFLETTNESIAFFNDVLLIAGRDHLRTLSGCSSDQAETLMRRHVGLCFDACHLAIQFENLADSLRRIRSEGIRVSKIHLSAALEIRNTPEARQQLAAFDEPVYLHQVVARTPQGEHRAWTDLPAALQALPDLDPELIARIHFHVPLFWEGNQQLASTSRQLDRDFFSETRQGEPPHLEIETYTFDVLPDDLRAGDVVDSIAGEFRWVLHMLNQQVDT